MFRGLHKLIQMLISLLLLSCITFVSGIRITKEDNRIINLLDNHPLCPLSISFDNGGTYSSYDHSCWYEQDTTISKCFTTIDRADNSTLSFGYDLEGESDASCTDMIKFNDPTTWTLITEIDDNNDMYGFYTPIPSIRTTAARTDIEFDVVLYVVCADSVPDDPIQFNSLWCINNCLILTIATSDAPILCAQINDGFSPTFAPTKIVPTSSPSVFDPLSCYLTLEDSDRRIGEYKHSCIVDSSTSYQRCFEGGSRRFTLDLDGGPNPTCTGATQLTLPDAPWIMVRGEDDNNNIGGFVTPYPSARIIATDASTTEEYSVYLTCGATDSFAYNATHCNGRCLVATIGNSISFDLCAKLSDRLCSSSVRTNGLTSTPVQLNRYCWTIPGGRKKQCWQFQDVATNTKHEFHFEFEGSFNVDCETELVGFDEAPLWDLVRGPDGNDGVNGFSTPYPSYKLNAYWRDNNQKMDIYFVCSDLIITPSTAVAYNSSECSNGNCITFTMEYASAPDMCNLLIGATFSPTTAYPSAPSVSPTTLPSIALTLAPSTEPSSAPSSEPSFIEPSPEPFNASPSESPSESPSVTLSGSPSALLSAIPSVMSATISPVVKDFLADGNKIAPSGYSLGATDAWWLALVGLIVLICYCCFHYLARRGATEAKLVIVQESAYADAQYNNRISMRKRDNRLDTTVV